MASEDDGDPGWPCPDSSDAIKDTYHKVGDVAVGRGAFAAVWKIKCVAEGPHKGRTVAAKIINLAKVNSSFEDIRVRAAAVSCAHPFGSARQLGSLPARERAERAASAPASYSDTD